MKKTYAPSSIIFGFLIGMLVWVSVNPVLGVLAGIAVCVVGWWLIRLLERTIDKGVDAAGKAISKAIDNKRNNKK